MEAISRFARRWATGFNALSLIALALVLAAGYAADRQNREAAMFQQRASVQKQISLIRAQLEGNINVNVQLVQGLIATLMTEPDMDQERFSSLAKPLFSSEHQLRHVAAAPGMVITLIHPLKDNEQAVGLDLGANPNQRAAVLKAKNSGESVFAGPVDLVQGGVGFIARFPVFTGTGGSRAFWGIVSAVIDLERLYSQSGLFNPDLPIEIALVGRDGTGASGEHFFGPASVLAGDPVATEVLLPSGSWQLIAVPKAGWRQTMRDFWFQRLTIAAVGLLVMLPLVVASYVNNQRRRNLRELQRREEHLQHLSRRLELALDASRVGVWDYAIETDELVWDDQMRQLYGIPADRVRVTVDDWRNALHPDDREDADRDFNAALQNRTVYKTEFRVLLPDGGIRHIRAKAAIHEGGNGATHIIGLNWDVTADVELQRSLKDAKVAIEQRNAQLEEAKAHIEHMALHDSLTGLPNRRYFDQVLSGQTRFNDLSESAPKALLIVDLDHFKQINDTMGHSAGDALLMHVSNILRSVARPSDFIARIGGDEFVIVCQQQIERQHLTILAQSIIAKTSQPMAHNGSACAFGVSIGIASVQDCAGDDCSLLVNADLALYQAKNTGRSNFAFFSHQQKLQTLKKRELADEIAAGLEAGEFESYYQIQYEARTQSIAGVEALVRWHHPDRGQLSPSDFLPTADEYNLTAQIDHAILKQTLRDLDWWSASGLKVPHASVNVSAQRLNDPDLVARLEDLEFAPGTLSFELLESIFFDDYEAIDIASIERIKDLGIEVEIDDFGTGHTSIISLLKINPSRLKIDRQLIIPMLTAPSSLKLVQSVIDIGRSLDIEVVAEGVETVEHARLLRDMGCDLLQGYAFGRPMPAREILTHYGPGSRQYA